MFEVCDQSADEAVPLETMTITLPGMAIIPPLTTI